jgi:hypothetical protein
LFGTLFVAVLKCTYPFVAECLHVQHLWRLCECECVSVCVSMVGRGFS